MTAHPPLHIYPQSTPDAGTTLCTSKAIPRGELIFRVERPLASALDQSRLRDTCAGCFIYLSENAVLGQGLKLKFCSGCKVVGYCSKTCQAESWKAHHKYECKVFNRLRPEILPNQVRVVMQLLYRRKAGSIRDEEWKGFLALQAHIKEFQSQSEKHADGLTTWQTIQLISQAALSYSESRESLHFILTVVARVVLNSHTLTTPTLDSIGVYISVPASLLNHSCAPNAALTFSLHGLLSVRSLTPILASSPITISYIHTNLSKRLRHAELSERYHFTCTCPVCTGPLSDPETDISNSEFRHLLTKDPPAGTTIADLLRAHAAFSSNTKPHQMPMPLLNQHIYLAAIDARHFQLAFTHTLVGYFLIDPVIRARPCHPLAVVRTWVMLRLLASIIMADLTPESVENGIFTIAGEELDLAIVMSELWNEVRANVACSHGDDSSFAEEVRIWGEQRGVMGSQFPDEIKKREWVKLRALAEKEYEGRGVGAKMC